MNLFRKNMIAVAFVFGLGIASAFAEDNANLCPDPTMRSWKLTPEFVLVEYEGLNGQTAIRLERTDPKIPVSILKIPISGLKPNTRYEFGAWTKTENVQPDNGQGILGAQVCTELFDCNKSVEGGKYMKGLSGTKDWTQQSGVVVTPESGFTHMELLFMLGSNLRDKNSCTGKVWYSNPYVRELKPEWFVDMIYPAMKYSLNEGKQDLIFSSYGFGLNDKNPMHIKIEGIRNGKCEFTENVSVDKHRFIIRPVLGKGDYTLNLTLTNDKTVLTKTIALRVADPSEKPGNAVYIDNKGRVIVNGKRFLPVCLLTNHFNPRAAKWGNTWKNTDYDRLQKSPFNCVLSNNITRQRTEGWKVKGNFWSSPTEENTKAALEIMDELHKRGIKMIYAALPLHEKYCYEDATGMENVVKKLVERFGKHPALLAWYINDERDVTANELKVRETLGRIDPWHPTYMVHFKFAYYAQFLGAADIYGMDNYPVHNEKSNMKILADALDAAHKVYGFNNTLSCWGMPQIFAWNTYNKSIPFYYPKENQMRSNMLIMALAGVKGFIMFDYESLYDAETADDNDETRWKVVCNATQILRDLEPYLLSDTPSEKLDPKVSKGEISASTFTADNGKKAVLIVSIASGDAEAEIKIPHPERYFSRYGNSTLDKNGVWTFRGASIDSDVLLPK